jgi:hypothetical protein
MGVNGEDHIHQSIAAVEAIPGHRTSRTSGQVAGTSLANAVAPS